MGVMIGLSVYQVVYKSTSHPLSLGRCVAIQQVKPFLKFNHLSFLGYIKRSTFRKEQWERKNVSISYDTSVLHEFM